MGGLRHYSASLMSVHTRMICGARSLPPPQGFWVQPTTVDEGILTRALGVRRSLWEARGPWAAGEEKNKVGWGCS